MAASDWEEIKRLAADFQRAQLSTTAHKLSERNCVEIVNKLVSLGLLEVIYTTDGKEYITPNQLEKEIRDELIVHGGRINLVDLQQILNVDLSHIESRVADIVRSDRHFTLVQGELLDRDYLDRTAEEINETLQESGQVTVADLAKTFNFPADFLLSTIEARLGILIHGQLDPVNRDVLFTPAFVARNISKIRGIFSAVTRPTVIAQLVATYGLPEKLFFNVLETLIESKRLSGAIQGHQEKAVYIPNIYSNTQTEYIDTFFDQNGYIEYHTLSKLGIHDGKQYLKKRFATRKDTLYLPSCCISSLISDQIDAAIDETLTNKSWLDIKTLVPSPFTNEDTHTLLQHLLKGPSRSTAHIFCQRIVTSQQCIESCKDIFQPLMKSQATKDIKTSPALFAELTKQEKSNLTESTGEGKQAKKDERHKKALAGGGQKGGSGRGGRESNTKKTKNKYRDRMKGNEDEEVTTKKKSEERELVFMTEEQIQEILCEKLKECEDDEFLEEVASYIIRPLTRQYQEVAKSIFISSSGSSASAKRKSHQDYQEKISGLLLNIRLFEKGLMLFEGDVRSQLSKHLLKSLASDVTNILFEMVANDNLMSLPENDVFTAETPWERRKLDVFRTSYVRSIYVMCLGGEKLDGSLDMNGRGTSRLQSDTEDRAFHTRLKLLNKLSSEWKTPLTKLNSSLNGKDLEEFYKQLDVITGSDFCDIMVKKVDKKKERQVMFNHRQALIDQLDRESEPAMALHLACVVLFQYHTNTLLHAPGRCVPQIIAYLQNNVSANDFRVLTEYQQLVVQQITKSKAKTKHDISNNHENEINDQSKSAGALLAERLTDIKQLVKNMKKQSSVEE